MCREAGEAESMVRDAIEKLGRLDYLVNNAGTSATGEPIAHRDLDRMTEEFWATIMATNLLGPFRCTKAAADALQGREAARCAIRLRWPASTCRELEMAYGASKAGLISLTKNLARALAPEARVNAVAPGFVDTGWTQALAGRAQAARSSARCSGAPARPQDIAAAIVFLCADDSMITAQTLVVDGGYSL